MGATTTQRAKARWSMTAVASTALVAGLFGIGGATAQADGACPGSATPANYVAPTDTAELFWEFEGKIAAVDTALRTMEVNGATFHIPDGLLIKTQSLDQVEGNISLDDLMAPGGIVGTATGIAEGQAVYTTTTDGQQCVTFEAGSVYVELAENVLVGSLTGVAPDGSSIQIAGSTVELNQDTRWPAAVIDGSGSEITLADLQGQEGSLVEAEGYYSTTRGALQATHVGTDRILVEPVNGDTVVVGRAEWKDRELRVSGSVTPAGTDKTVTFYSGALSGTTCDTSTAAIGTTTVGVDGAYSYRNRNVPTAPSIVCVQSSGGGAEDSAVEIDN